MKRICALFLILVSLAVMPVIAERPLTQAGPESPQNPALSLALDVEGYLQGSYSTMDVPALFWDELAEDYHMIARADEEGRRYALASRRASAPPLPEGLDVEQNTDGGWGEPLTTLAWRLGVADEEGELRGVVYSFSNLSNVMIEPFDNYKTILILPDTTKRPLAIPQVEDISEAMTARGRARIQYRLERGFVARDNSRWQISVQVHSRETYLAGVPYVPTTFYLNLPEDMKNLPKRIGKAKASKKSAREKGLFEAGAGLSIKSEAYTLYTNKKGVKGYFERTTSKGKETWHNDVNTWSRIMEIAQDHANVKPETLSIGNMTSAPLEWPSGDLGLYDGAPPQSQTIIDEKSLSQLKKLFSNVKYGSGSGCPFSAFLTLTRKNGKSVTIAIATDSCNMAYLGGGLSFEYGGSQKKLLALFDKIDYERNM